MSRVTRLLSAAAIAFLAMAARAPAAPAPSDASALSIVPASAPIVVSLRGVEGTTGRFLVMLKQALPELAGTVEEYIKKAMAGDFTEGRRPRGLAKDGPIFLVFTEIPKPGDAEPKIAVVLSITKYEEFRDNLLSEDERKTLKTDPAGFETATMSFGETIHLINKKEFAVVTPVQDVAEAFTKKPKGIDEHISKEQSAKLLAGDIGVYFSMDTLNKQYADQIKTARETAREGLKTLSETVEKSQRSAFVFLQKILDPTFQGIEDSRGILLTLEFRPGGLAVHVETEIRPGTPTAKALEGNKGSAFKGLETMPGGLATYIGMEANKKMVAALSEIVFASSVTGDDKAEKATRAAIDELVQSDPGTSLNAYNIPMQGIQVSHYADPAKAVVAQLKLFAELASGTAYSSGLLKEKPKVTPKAEKYGDFEFTSVELRWDAEKMAQGAGGPAPLPDEAKKQIATAIKKVLGESQTSWIGTDGKVVLQVTAKDWATAKKLLDNHAKGTDTAAKVAAFRDVRGQLPAEANIIALADVVRYIGLMLETAKPIIENMLPLPVKLPTMPANLPITYCGAAVTLKADRASVDAFISVGTVHEFYKAYVLPLFGAGGGAS
jgi:hypothetical protein